MDTIRRRLNIILALTAVCLPGALHAAVVEAASLAPALAMAQSAPAFRASVLSQISLVNSLSAQPIPTLSLIVTAAPTPADPWHAEAARFVGALVAQPQAVALHQNELRTAFGDRGAGLLKEASTRLQARAAEHPELTAQLKNLRRGVDLSDAGAVQELGARLNALFDNSKSRPEGAAGGAVAASVSAHKQNRMPGAWKLQPSKQLAPVSAEPLAADWRAKILARPQYQGFDVKVKFEKGIALENLVGTIGVDGIVTRPDGDRVTATIRVASLKRAAEISRLLAGYDFVDEVSVARSVAWRLDEVRRLPKSSDTRFENPALVGPAVAKIKELFSGVKARGDGEYVSKQGRRERLASVRVSPAGEPQAGRVTLDINRRWRGSESPDSLSVTLIAGERPAILVQSKPGAGIFPRPGSFVEWARLFVDRTTVMLILEADDGSVASYEIALRPDGGMEFIETGYTGTVRTTLPKK